MSTQEALTDLRMYARESVRLYFEPVLWFWHFVRWLVRSLSHVLLIAAYHALHGTEKLLSGMSGARKRRLEIDLVRMSMRDREAAASNVVDAIRADWHYTTHLLWKQSKREPDRKRFEAAVLEWLQSEALLMTWLEYTKSLDVDKPLLVEGATHLLTTLLETESQIITRLAAAAASVDARKEVLELLRHYVEQREQRARTLRELLGMEQPTDDSEAWKRGAPPGWRSTPTR